MDLIKAKDDQLEAVEKFRNVAAAFIGDEMGLGKTVTAIERDLQLRKDHDEGGVLGPTLIVTEKIGLDVWSYHLLAMGCPEDYILVINPKDRKEFEAELEELREDLFRKRTPRYQYYIMHYDVLRLINKVLLETPHPITWFHVIADEFHLIKNPKAVRTKTFKRIRTRYKTGLTGTPADNNPNDIWSLLNWLYPRDYRSSWRFWNSYLEFEDKVRHDHYTDATGQRRVNLTGYREITGVKNLGRLHREIATFYIRRRLVDVIENMPDKVPVRPPITVDMTPAQKRMYAQMAKRSMARIGDMNSGTFVLTAPAVVAMVQRLQQMALGTLVPLWEAEEGVSDDDVDWDHPRIAIERPSPKLDAVMEMITNHDDEQFVIFSWFRGMVDLIEDECRRQKISVVKIHGGVTSNRTKLVEEFQSGKARIFVGTIAAAGRVITLDQAHHVIFTDRSWNPNRNEQAEGRLWRRNQKNAVMVHTIETRDSIDQIRAEKIHSKAELVEAIADPSRYR